MDGSKANRARNVLFVVLDTVRASASYVGGTPFTPTLASVADDGADFKRAIAPAAWTLPSHASMYTGLYPTEHGAIASHRFAPDEHELLAETVSQAGIGTGLFTANAFLTESFNMARGFDQVSFIRGEANKYFQDGLDPVAFLNEREYDSGLPRFKEIGTALSDGPVLKNVGNALYFKVREELRRRRGPSESSWDEQAVAATREFVSERAASDEQFFAMVNLIGAHAPWKFDRERLESVGVTPEEVAPVERWKQVADVSEAQWPYAAGEIEFDETDREILRYLYRAWVHHVDGLAGDLLSALEEAGVEDETLVILTADHGEQLARDGVLGHSVSVDECVTHVPLVVDGPGVPEGRTDRPVSLTNLYGTVLAALGIEESTETVFDDGAKGEAYTETYGIEASSLADEYAHIASEFGPRRALYIDDTRAEYRERTDETLGDPALFDRLEEFWRSLEPYVGEHEEDLPDAVQERLEELGYV